MITELLCLLLLIAIFWGYRGKRDGKFPPGPTGFGWLDYVFMFGSRVDKTLMRLKRTGSPIIGARLGIYRVILINDAKLIREAMNIFSGRPRLNIFTNRNGDGIARGILMTDGPQWKEQRRFALKNLRDFGFRTKTMEAKVQEEIDELLESFKDNEVIPMEGKHLFNRPVINALWSIMFSNRFEKDSPDILVAFEGLSTFNDKSSILRNAAIFSPWISKVAPKLSGFEQMMQGFSQMKGFIRNQIKHHNIHHIENQPRDFVDAYTDEVNKTRDPNSSFYFKNDVMTESLIDLFGAGTETVSSTLAWCCVYLIHHGEVQKKLQEEIDDEVGKNRHPSLADRPSMPYTEAVIHEVLRISSVLPLGIVHSATDDTEFHGYFIPKDTIIIPNFYGVHYDEEIWGDPENFRPERFIDSNGFKKNENLLAFSTGKRVCLGEGLARDQLFLFITRLFQNFSVSVGGQLPCLEKRLGFTFTPQPFEMILRKRPD